MFNRLARIFRSFAGMFISFAEDPEVLLEQNIRDMNDQVPRMNESIAMVKANVTLLEKEQAKYQQEVSGLTSRLKAAIQSGRDDIAATYATQLESIKSALARNEAQLGTARAAFDKSMNVKKAFLREKERKTQEAMAAIRDYRRSQWQKKVADSLEQFEVAGISQTHDDMIGKIQEQTALGEARMEMALSNVDQQKFEIEEEAEKIRANELVKQFKAEMGLLTPQASSAPADKTLGERERQANS